MASAYEQKRTQVAPEVALAKVAATRHGLVTREQALGEGLSGSTIQRRITDGFWEPLYPGIYRMTAFNGSWRQALLAACLAWGSRTAASHDAAASLFGLSMFD